MGEERLRDVGNIKNNFNRKIKTIRLFTAGGLLLLWNQELKVSILSANKFWIQALIEHPVFEKPWVIVCAYGSPYNQLKERFWNELTNLILQIKEPWLLLGDLNEIMHEKDKRGGRTHIGTSRAYLESFMVNTGSIDLDFSGYPFTWSNNRPGLGHIKHRIDRALASQEWFQLFARSGVNHLTSNRSDHNPIEIKLWKSSQNYKKPFKFEAMWIRDKNSTGIVRTAWNLHAIDSEPYKLTRKIKNTKTALRTWNRSTFGHCELKITELMKEIEFM